MKSVLISIQPKWCELIASGEKTIEVRKSRPKIETPFKCYIYCTYGQENENYMLGKRGKVIGDFVCDRIVIFEKSELGIKIKDFFALAKSCVKVKEMREYIGENKIAYGWHISDLKIYDKPKKLGEFRKPCPYGDLPCSICPSCDKDENDSLIQCFNTVSRPPKSWCYVEEI